MFMTHKVHTSPRTGLPARLTIRIKATEPGDIDEAVAFKFISRDFLISLVNRRVAEAWNDSSESGAMFTLRRGDDLVRIEGLLSVVRAHLRLAEDQLAGKREEEKDRARSRAFSLPIQPLA